RARGLLAWRPCRRCCLWGGRPRAQDTHGRLEVSPECLRVRHKHVQLPARGRDNRGAHPSGERGNVSIRGGRYTTPEQLQPQRRVTCTLYLLLQVIGDGVEWHHRVGGAIRELDVLRCLLEVYESDSHAESSISQVKG